MDKSEKKQWYEVSLYVTNVQGYQTFCVKAESKEEAYEKYLKNFGNFDFVEEELEVQGFEDPNGPQDFTVSNGPPEE